MRLLCLHAQTIKALASLHAPFDDLTPDGLWGSEYHLIGITQAQRDVLSGWGIELEDITPEKLGASARSEGQRQASGRPAPPTPRAEPRQEPQRDEPPQMSREPARPSEKAESRTAGTPERGKPAAPQPSPAVATSEQSRGGVATRAPMKLRTRLKGKYKEAFVQDGKIHLDGQQFDSPIHASRSLAPDKRDWELWEYFDEDAGKWYMLDREWEAV